MDTRMRERLAALAEDAPTVLTPPPGLTTRARRRAVFTATAFVVAVGVIVSGGVVGARVLTRGGRVPAAPHPVRPFDGVRGWIVVGGRQLMAVNPANPSDQVQLTTHDGVIDSPLGWSSDGAMLLFKQWAFSNADTAPSDLYVLHADGSEVQLTHDGAITGASFSPDGSQVVYGLTTGNGSSGYASGIYVVPSMGGTPARLSHPGGPVGEPVWSPDGSRIAYVGGTVGDPSIDTVAADGSHGHTLLSLADPGFVDIAGMAWSPDGSTLVFGGMMPDIHTSQLYSMSADGSSPLTQLTHEGSYNVWPSWSPDGTRIAYIAGQNLTTMDPDGSHRDRLTEASPEAGSAWSPFGA
ncbi:MAG: TolB protein [Actinomycetota bacterium]|jgi:Tol biopolymer transport system component|nr:TolB protein [Actinomycetota bacterium]